MRSILVIILLASLASCKQTVKGIDPRVLTLPSFNLLLLDSVHTINTKNIQKGKPTILINFAPDCSSCAFQTEQLVTNPSLLHAVNIYMCSPYPLYMLKDYVREHALNKFSNITVGRDINFFFQNELKVPSYPWLFIYSADKKLKKIITGGTDVQTLLHLLNG